MNRSLGLVAVAALGAAVLAPRTARAQASESEMRAFPMPPPSGYFASKNFSYVGDYGYYTAPSSAEPSGTDATAASDYKYVRYTGIAGKRVFVYGAWGPSVPPDPPGEADACGHAHASWGAWARWWLVFPFWGFMNGWSFVGGGGMSGQRQSSGRCTFSPANPLASIDPRFGWGSTYKELDLRGGSLFTQLVVGALSNTHGWGTCTVPAGSFPACNEPSYIIGYTLP